MVSLNSVTGSGSKKDCLGGIVRTGSLGDRGERFRCDSISSCLNSSSLHRCFLVLLAGGGVTGGEEDAGNGGGVGERDIPVGSSVDGWSSSIDGGIGSCAPVAVEAARLHHPA